MHRSRASLVVILALFALALTPSHAPTVAASNGHVAAGKVTCTKK